MSTEPNYLTHPDIAVGTVSEPCVMKTPAGYYIGTYYQDRDMGPVPNSRDSGYFPTREEADGFLAWQNA
jgi:hypothetical protein